MKTVDINTEKKFYNPPHIELIRLDNEISLQLASDTTPPEEPGWTKAEQQMSNDPYKMA